MYNSPYKYKTFRDVVLEKGAFTPWNKNEWGSPNTKRAWALAPPGNDNDHLNAEQEAIWSMAWDVAERMYNRGSKEVRESAGAGDGAFWALDDASPIREADMFRRIPAGELKPPDVFSKKNAEKLGKVGHHTFYRNKSLWGPIIEQDERKPEHLRRTKTPGELTAEERNKYKRGWSPYSTFGVGEQMEAQPSPLPSYQIVPRTLPASIESGPAWDPTIIDELEPQPRIHAPPAGPPNYPFITDASQIEEPGSYPMYAANLASGWRAQEEAKAEIRRTQEALRKLARPGPEEENRPDYSVFDFSIAEDDKERAEEAKKHRRY